MKMHHASAFASARLVSRRAHSLRLNLLLPGRVRLGKVNVRPCRALLACPALLVAFSTSAAAAQSPAILGISNEYVLFALTLLGVAIFHRRTLQIALSGLFAIIVYKLAFTGFPAGPGLAGLALHMQHEWVVLANLLCLLVGFALLADHFEKSHVTGLLPRLLPGDWKGCFALLVVVFVLSGFLDNIAAGLIGGTIAASLFKRKVHIGYLAAIVAAANAGGAGSVVGDTTTTMMWLGGVSPLSVLAAYLAAAVALLVCGIPAAFQQQRYAPMVKDGGSLRPIDLTRIAIVALILGAAIAANVAVNLRFRELIGNFPAIGVAVWIAIIACAPWRMPAWNLIPEATKGSVFLLALVICASLMPVENLPDASWQSSLALGFISSVFDNIPLTALALKQGGYDWGMLAFAVGFGGSITWFGSSAGVALASMYPEARSVGLWLRHGWHVAIAYVMGFLTMLVLLGWHPD